MKAKIIDIRICRRYGFNDGGAIDVETFGKNKRTIHFFDRSAWVEEYAIRCGINEEAKLEKLIGRKVTLTQEETEDGNIVWLSLPDKYIEADSGYDSSHKRCYTYI